MLAREGDGRIEQTVLHHRIDKPEIDPISRADRIAAQDHLERRSDADEARQTLRSPGAGEQSPFDLRQGQPRFGCGDAIVARQRQLESAPHRVALQRRQCRKEGR